MANYDAMLEQKKARVKKNINLINNACAELIDLDDDITYKIISERTNIPIKTLQNKSYKECISNWRNCHKNKDNDEESNIYLKEINHLKKVIQQLRKQTDQLKYELYIKETE
ncbi:hypothetical protein BCD91_001783 [Clostridium beijerinckii]|uniref:hypothetical protein n=1 Tax=Clostridium beijerinckii TaxID=1520 RepID=UPI0014945579|nr:hypothetical protein [Clostridium beijerinckii]NOW89760.1 hypothetical protein [Clostridium beijerinckii]